VCAPTSTAAHNVGGVTLHHLGKMGVDNHDYIPKAMTATRQKMLVCDFKSLLTVIIGKRSLLASKDLGTTETVIGETIHSGGILNSLVIWWFTNLNIGRRGLPTPFNRFRSHRFTDMHHQQQDNGW